MPIYEYICLNCGKRHEVVQKINDGALKVCPDCSGTLKKLISSTSFMLKGSGWYLTDYARADKKGSAKKADTPVEKP